MVNKIDAYAVFDGGGVKGIAFAGALKAVSESNIKFAGYAGASAGAIIAFLSSIGFTGDEIFKKIQFIDFIGLLEQPVTDELHIVKSVIVKRKAIGWIKKKPNFLRILKQLWKLYYCVSNKERKIFDDAMNRLFDNNGFYKKTKIEELLKAYSHEKLTINKTSNAVFLSFAAHFKHTNIDLRIIATDITSGNAVEFSHKKTPDICVIQALLASASYPIVFEPSNFNGNYLADGGLSCNLPTYLFHKDSFKRLPIFAFDLVSTPPKKTITTKVNFFEHVNSLINSSLDASTNIISDVSGGIAIPIRVPNTINATDFKLTDKQMLNLFKRGEKFTRFFINNTKLMSFLDPSQDVHSIARLLYGKLEPMLEFLISYLPEKEEVVKVWLYTTINHYADKLVSFAKTTNKDCDNQIKDHIFDLNHDDKINTGFSCVRCWKSTNTTIFYDESKGKTFINYPIKISSTPDNKAKQRKIEMIAVLTISVEQHVLDCNWVKVINNSQDSTCSFELDISEDISMILFRSAKIIRNAILGHQMLFHENRGGIENV
ncbi:patatin-like phospholipase family protein [Winslowiella sp. 2C04]|uniref:patatin-like phospholipase family protein n=1 Tax=Winslowiella sp. 2C04 TaxID=3416179 RepID=UPI003CF4BA5C